MGMGNWSRMSAVLLLTAAVSLYAKPGKGNHYGTDDNSGKHVGWGNSTDSGINVEVSEDYTDNASAPVGQPLPGALAALALGGITLTAIRRRQGKR